MTTPVEFKRGATFSAALVLTVTVNDLAVTDLTGWTGVAQARRANGQLVENLGFAWIDAAQRLAALTSAGTDGWPLGTVEIDALMTSPSGVKVATPTIQLRVIQGPTDV